MSEKMVVCGIEFKRTRDGVWEAKDVGKLRHGRSYGISWFVWEATLDVSFVGTGETAEQALRAALYSLDAVIERRKERLEQAKALAVRIKARMQRGGA
jgi:hypothetical protein